MSALDAAQGSLLNTSRHASSGSRAPLPYLILVAVLLLLMLALIYRLVFGDGSIQEVWRLHQITETQRQEIEKLQLRNQALQAEVDDLKKGLQAVEERARSELGMIRRGEVFYQFIDRDRSGDEPDQTPIQDNPAQ